METETEEKINELKKIRDSLSKCASTIDNVIRIAEREEQGDKIIEKVKERAYRKALIAIHKLYVPEQARTHVQKH